MITRSSGGIPSGCRPRDVATLLTRFFDAFNAGEWDTIDAVFAPAGSNPLDFELFAVSRDVVYDRNQLISFLTAVRLRGERFRLVALRVERAAPEAASVDYVFEGAGGMANGKALVDCGSERIWQGAMSASGAPSLPCPIPSGWSSSGPIVACTGGPNAQALSTNFRLATKQTPLPGRCRPVLVLRRIRSFLSAFNRGDGAAVARQFVSRGSFLPYARRGRKTLVGSSAISAFVARRYQSGDGWTANSLRAGGTRTTSLRRAAYTVGLVVSHQTRRVGAGQAISVVDCRSGRLERWVGPAIDEPGQ